MASRPFTDTINALRYGTLNEDLTAALNDLVKVCDNTGKAGELTLKLKLKPGKGGQMEIIDELIIKAPKEEKGTSIFFATPEGNLTREDPRQLNIEGLRSLDMETGELRRVAQ
jgi:hypothetical protein